MSALDDLLSGGVKARDALTQLLAPAIDWYNAQPSWLERAAEASATNDPTTMRPSPEQLALGADTAGGFVGAIKAYHGSPYDFAKFDTSKIGTGEGAQAYGHGLYFAENPATAQSYKEALGARSGPISYANQLLTNTNGDVDAAIAMAKSPRETTTGAGRSYGEDAIKHLEALKAGVTPPNPGKMYEVNINAEPEHFLDWDKPLSEQPSVLTRLQSIAGARPIDKMIAEHVTGPKSQLPGELLPGIKSPAGTETLREAGIPGIKYLDQGSRGGSLEQLKAQLVSVKDKLKTIGYTSERDALLMQKGGLENQIKNYTPPTNNYVVFDDKLIDIVKKYGVAGLMLSGAGGAVLGEKPR